MEIVEMLSDLKIAQPLLKLRINFIIIFVILTKKSFTCTQHEALYPKM